MLSKTIESNFAEPSNVSGILRMAPKGVFSPSDVTDALQDFAIRGLEVERGFPIIIPMPRVS